MIYRPIVAKSLQFYRFLPRHAMLPRYSAIYAVNMCLSVRLSVSHKLVFYKSD